MANPALPCSSETGVSSGIRGGKNNLSESAQCQKAIGGIHYKITSRPEALHHGVEIGTFSNAAI